MSADRTISVHMPRYAVWLLACLMLAPWVFVGVWLLRSPRTAALLPAAHTLSADEAKSAASGRRVVHPGPWGNLEAYRILIEPPEEFILTSYTTPNLQPWVFKGYTEAALSALWQSAGLSRDQIAFLSNPAHRELQSDAIVIRPTAEFITDLTPGARAKLYAALSAYPENASQYSPFRLRASLADHWLDNSDLPADAIALTQKLFYPRGTATCFSDEAVVLPLMHDDSDRVKYIKALSRKAALMLYLDVSPGEDVDKLVAYWGRGGRSKDLKPLLQSVARLPGGGRIDVLHLLPRFVRLLAYTYPLPSNEAVDANHDCHWTSFNFQNDVPDEHFSDINYVRKVLLEQYYPVPGEPLLGDIIMFVQHDGVVLHSCVYIADDIVFTKNGPAFSVPWLLSPLADVKAFYADNPDIEIRRFRQKNL